MELTDQARYPWLREVALSAVLAAICLLAYWSLRLTWADWLARKNDTVSVRRAAALSPGDALLRIKLARALAKDGLDPAAALETAAALNPHDAGTWVRLGLNAETRGNEIAAERDLLEAARVSRQFDPRWTLANFYFRRRDMDRFWVWMRESLQVASGDFTPEFNLCWAATQDAGTIMRKAIPERPAVLSGYLIFLLQQNRAEEGGFVAQRLVTAASHAECPSLLAWSDRMLQANRPAPVLEVWNAICRRRLLPFAPLSPEKGVSLTDGAFHEKPVDGGFAWRLKPADGVSCGRNVSPDYLFLSFSGKQARHCEPISQFVPVLSGRNYKLRFQYRTSEMPAASGLRWRVLDAASGVSLETQSPWLSSPVWKEEQAFFRVPSKVNLTRLVFTYERAADSSPTEGSVLLRNLNLEPAP